MHTYHSSQGLVKAVFLIVTVLIILAFWGFDLKDYVSVSGISERAVVLWGIVKDTAVKIWEVMF